MHYAVHEEVNRMYTVYNCVLCRSAKATNQAGSEFMLPLCCHRTLGLLGIQESELAELCTASTAFMSYVVDQVQDNPALFGLPTTPA